MASRELPTPSLTEEQKVDIRNWIEASIAKAQKYSPHDDEDPREFAIARRSAAKNYFHNMWYMTYGYYLNLDETGVAASINQAFPIN